MSARHYDRPGFSDRIFNAMVAGLARLGISLWSSCQLSVRGRKSGLRRAVPVNVVQHAGVLFSQPANAISIPLITIVVLWLTFIFTTFTFAAPANPLIVVVLLVAALSAASAIFLILDLDRPFGGLLQIPSLPLRNALPALAELAR